VPIDAAGPITIVARADDPGGDAPWAVRHVRARQGGATFPCRQLGRLDGERFGWISPDSPFRPALLDQRDVPTLCGPSLRGGRPQLWAMTLTTDAAAGLPQPARSIVWGVLPPGATSARLSDGTLLQAARGGDGAVLAVLPGRPVGEPLLSGTLTTSTGTRRFTDPRLDQRRQLDRRTGRSRRGGRPIDDRATIAVRVPDPAGGAAWGILVAPSTTGATCISDPGRLVGQRLADVDPRLGVASASPFTRFDCSGRRAPTAAHPLRMDVAGFSISDEDPTGTLQLRRLGDRTVLHGRTTAGVPTVTITTSRDIRTLTPDPRTHTLLAVYDGSFPSERLKFTATLRDGRRVTLLQSSGG
jgi:hypothetical protein